MMTSYHIYSWRVFPRDERCGHMTGIRHSQRTPCWVGVRSAGSGLYRLAHTGLTNFEEGASEIPTGAIPAEDAGLICEFAKHGPVEMHLLQT